MAHVFDLLDIDLVRIANQQFEGTGSIPIPEDGAMFGKRGLSPLLSNLTAVRFRIAVTVVRRFTPLGSAGQRAGP